MDDYESWRRQQWPPVGTDMGRRAEWLSPSTAEAAKAGVLEAIAYIRAVLTGDDLVEPDVRKAELAVSLLAGWLGGYGVPLDELMTEAERAFS